MGPQLLQLDSLSSSFLSSTTLLPALRTPPPSSPNLLTISAVKIDENPKYTTNTNTSNSIQTKSSKKISAANQTPPPQARPSIAAAICNALDGIINSFVDPGLRPSVDPRHVLALNFGPVGELPPTPCPILRGALPPCLAGGAYLRNGPNPQHLPRGPHHLFDGDGMLHSLLLPSSPGAAATFTSRYVRTYKYGLEREAGGPVLPNVFSGFHGAAGVARGAVSAARVLTGQLDLREGFGLANTSVAFFHERLYALGESDLPYVVHLSTEDGDIRTVGRWNFRGRLAMSMTAHPKKDQSTGELLAFRIGPMPPFLTYFRFDREGNKYPDVPIYSLTRPSFLHDFAITSRHCIFPDIQIGMNPVDMIIGGGSPVGSDPGKIPRLGVLSRYATSESGIRWFEVPGFNMIHALNAWEEDDGSTIVLVAPNILSIEHALDKMELVHACVELLKLNLKTGSVSRIPLSAGNLDFGVIHPGYVGRKNRYAYLGVGDPMPKIGGVVKLDFEMVGRGDCEVARREFGPGCFGGEPFFVPAKEGEGEEDEGYVVSYVHDEGRGESRFVVMDARSPVLEIVAEVLLPRRVPYGFHGIFVSAAELQSQIPI